MSVLSRLLEFRALTTQTIFSRDLDLIYQGRNEAGINITQRNALNDTAVWAAVSFIAGDISGLPVHAVRTIGDVRQPMPDPSWLHEPDPLDPNSTWVDHISTTAISGLLDGNGYVLAEPSVIDAQRLEVLNPTIVTVRQKRRTRIYDLRLPDGRDELTAANIIHVNFFRRPGELTGISPIDEHAEMIGLSRAAEKYSARFFGSGATLSGIVEIPASAGDFTEDDVKGLRQQFASTHGGWRKSYALGVLTGGATWKPTGANPKDSQLTELRQYQVEETARLYGLPPHYLGSQLPGAVAYASVEQRAIDYVTHCLVPRYLRPLELAYSRLVPGDGRLAVPGSNTGIRFNVNGLLRGDATARAAFYKARWEIGSLSPNDVRRYEDESPIDNGDDYYYPINYAPLGQPVAAGTAA